MRNCCLFKRSLFMILLFSLSLFSQESSPIKIVTPAPFHISEENSVGVVVEANSSLVEYFIIISDSNFTKRIDVNEKRSHYCENVPLILGKNKIIIDAFKDDVSVMQVEQFVYLTSKVYKEFKYPPQEYDRDYFHVDKKEAVCLKCHDMSVNEVPGVAFEDISKSNCYQCHHQIAEKKYGHAPAVNWLCTSCHNGKVGKYNKFEKDATKYTVPDPVGELCFSCHKKTKKVWHESQFIHEPVESGRCNKCHSSHSSTIEYYLKKPVWDLCQSCHNIDGSHITKTLRGAPHPTKGVKDPSRPGKDLSCISCHKAHVSNSASLLRSNTVFGLCVKCHKK